MIPFGKYLLLDRIAVGGMAEVYTAKSFGIEGFEKIIAIKRILPTMAEDQDFIAMFIDEAKIAGHLTHASVVPIYELGKIGESHYIAMEYVWGKDLLQIMNRFRRMRRHMPPVMAAWIAAKMLEGLDYAHRKRDRHGRPMGIIHRDVSPQNALVSYEGQVKLIDFGIAKAASRNTKTQAGVLKGKFGYMSPEQVRGMPIDHRSDIFAASVCLHEMLTGERLFVGESDFSTLEKVRNADVVRPSQSVPDVSPELEEIVLKGLAREPDDRWQTAGEMQEELQRFIALQRPPFGTSKLNTWMRTAFAPEIAKEKGRLDSFNKVGHPGGGAAGQGPTPPHAASSRPVPPPPPRPPAAPKPAVSDAFAIDDEDEFGGGEATMITSSPFDEMEAARAGGGGGNFDEIPEEATQIFFSADDMEEIPDEGAAAPAGSLAPAPLAAQLPPPQAVGAAGVHVQGPAPTPQPRPFAATMQMSPMQGAPGQPMPQPMGQPHGHAFGQPQPGQPHLGQPQDMFAAPPGGQQQRHMPTMEVDRPGQLQPAADKKGGMGKLIAILAAAAFLVVALSVGGAIIFLSGDETGTVSVRVAPEGADARVFVDGVQRGRAPLLLEHVPTGEHSIEVRADGYRGATRAVPVNAGSTAMLEIALESETPAIAGAGPAVAVAPPPPVTAAAVVAPTEAAPAPAPAEAAPPPAEPTPPTPAPGQAATADPPHRPREASGGGGGGSGSALPRRIAREEADPPPRRGGGGGATAGAGRGMLTINTMPWARVFVDGRDTGRNTPVRNFAVSPGAHTIGLRTNDGTMHTVQVTVAAGATERIVRQL